MPRLRSRPQYRGVEAAREIALHEREVGAGADADLEDAQGAAIRHRRGRGRERGEIDALM